MITEIDLYQKNKIFTPPKAANFRSIKKYQIRNICYKKHQLLISALQVHKHNNNYLKKMNMKNEVKFITIWVVLIFLFLLAISSFSPNNNAKNEESNIALQVITNKQ